MLPSAFLFSSDNQLCESLSQHFELHRNGHHADEDVSWIRPLLVDSPRTIPIVDVREGTTTTAGLEALRFLATDCSERRNCIAVTDGFLPRLATVWLSILSPEYLEFPFRKDELNDTLGVFETRRVNRGAWVKEPRIVQSESTFFGTYTPELFPVIDQLVQVAPRDVTLLLVGETGTGKTTMAQLIHQMSERSGEPFQNVACGALPPDLIESELFGHIRGAFTSADRNKIGRFEAAGRGTLLLDEIDVLGPKEQAKLLKVIETGEFEPVGSTETRNSHARLIVASNVDLETLTSRNQFRSDLYYRLNVLEFRLPPLRERPLDIVPLALQFIEQCCAQHRLTVNRLHLHFLDSLRRYAWPGNLRELKNQIQRAALFCRDEQLTAEDLSPCILEAHESWNGSGEPGSVPTTLAERVAITERRILEETLRAHNYKRTSAAAALGISRVGLYKKMRKHGMLDKRDELA